MKKILASLFMLAAFHAGATAQTFLEHVQEKNTQNASVTVKQSSEIDDLVNSKVPLQETKTGKPAPEKTGTTVAQKPQQDNNTVKKPTGNNTDNDVNETEPATKQVKVSTRLQGYKVQAYAGGNSRAAKQQAYAIQEKIRKSLPNVPTSVHFQSPRWVCQAGNCRTIEEANQLMQQIKSIGIPSAIVIKHSARVRK